MRDLRQVIAWSKKTGDGSRSDLPVSPAARRVGRSGKRQQQLPGSQMPDAQGLLLLPRPAAVFTTLSF